mmetsp:Transcript_59701/g.132978  ORF Transcript_59701/g.132978 Transcript_59701/m.132978 type:complete len:204 (-) Transcript_59701:400-1011(-)
MLRRSRISNIRRNFDGLSDRRDHPYARARARAFLADTAYPPSSALAISQTIDTASPRYFSAIARASGRPTSLLGSCSSIFSPRTSIVMHALVTSKRTPMRSPALTQCRGSPLFVVDMKATLSPPTVADRPFRSTAGGVQSRSSSSPSSSSRSMQYPQLCGGELWERPGAQSANALALASGVTAPIAMAADLPAESKAAAVSAF